MSMPLVVSIGTVHPWNIAGVGLDLRVCTELGVRNASVVAGVSAQDEQGIRALHAVPLDVLHAQLETLPGEIAAVRIGAIPGAQGVREVARFAKSLSEIPVVVDPVFTASLGGAFADDETVEALRDELAFAPIILTPNMDEAARLLDTPVVTPQEMRAAAAELVRRGTHAVFLKGGHIEGEPLDMLATTDAVTIWSESRLPGSMRGTGCVLAAALAARLALGDTLVDAAAFARTYVRERITAQRMLGTLQVAF